MRFQTNEVTLCELRRRSHAQVEVHVGVTKRRMSLPSGYRSNVLRHADGLACRGALRAEDGHDDGLWGLVRGWAVTC